jgi:hypothetical protein
LLILLALARGILSKNWINANFFSKIAGKPLRVGNECVCRALYIANCSENWGLFRNGLGPGIWGIIFFEIIF